MHISWTYIPRCHAKQQIGYRQVAKECRSGFLVASIYQDVLGGLSLVQQNSTQRTNALYSTGWTQKPRAENVAAQTIDAAVSCLDWNPIKVLGWPKLLTPVAHYSALNSFAQKFPSCILAIFVIPCPSFMLGTKKGRINKLLNFSALHKHLQRNLKWKRFNYISNYFVSYFFVWGQLLLVSIFILFYYVPCISWALEQYSILDRPLISVHFL